MKKVGRGRGRTTYISTLNAFLGTHMNRVVGVILLGHNPLETGKLASWFEDFEDLNTTGISKRQHESECDVKRSTEKRKEGRSMHLLENIHLRGQVHGKWLQ